ncbi:PAS domain-containing protein [Desulfosediminicola ganghwensis]|uniref:PAS domain-containing protein n=1 Tax=Desulfosediminicola ganghwensis TaxID=2569540 RepID=UPI0010AD38A7|nr:PAS domain-containing protein [Desulfosediminicola ganghwensis]
MPNDKLLSEEAVRKQLSFMTSVINSIPDLIFYKDLEGVYLGGNKAFAELIGQSIEEVVGKTDFDLFPENVARFFREKDHEMLDSRHTKRNDEWVDYPDGRHVLLDTLKTPLFDEHGNLCGLLGISRDITGR